MKKYLFRTMGTVLSLSLLLSITGCENITKTANNKGETTPSAVETVAPVQKTPTTMEVEFLTVDAASLNVRSLADVDSEKVGTVLDNQKFNIISEGKDTDSRVWYQVQLPDGKMGWIASWFCLKTKITVSYIDELASITAIEDVLPLHYLENPFDAKSVALKDVVMGLSVEKIETQESGMTVGFSGQVQLTGAFTKETAAGGERIRFEPDATSKVMLPVANQEQKPGSFIFSNFKEASELISGLGTKGTATVIIDHYTIAYGKSTVVNQAELVEIVNKQ